MDKEKEDSMNNQKSLIARVCILGLIGFGLLSAITACSTPTPTPAPTPAPKPTSAPQPVAEKTIKIGLVTWLGWPLGLEMQKGVEMMAEVTNKKGGLEIGGEKYKIQVVVYDSKSTPETGRAAVERMLDQDKVQFILGDETAETWSALTEAKKVVAIVQTPTPGILNPKNKYIFQGTVVNSQFQQTIGWLLSNNSNFKTVMSAHPDDQIGHISSDQIKQLCTAFGVKYVDAAFYPRGTTDLSAIGTKVKSVNPDLFLATAGGPGSDGGALKAARQVGYKGQIFHPAVVPFDLIKLFVPAQDLEGFVSGADALEMSKTSPAAKEYLDAYVAKYGTKDIPDLTGANTWYILVAALQKAGSTDPDKVAAAIGSGLKYESASGSGMMIARPDLGNERTVDTIVALSLKKVENGKVSPLATMTLDQAYQLLKKAYGWK
jgi:branched-chain amino acid transport system substrate-binding protein